MFGRFPLLMRRPWLLLLLLAAAVGEEDLYELLNIDESASDREIKVAYRKASLKHHPDKGGDVAMFKQVSRAYEVLSAGEKRALYDAGGLSAVEQGHGRTDPWGRPVGPQKGNDVSVTVSVSLEDFYRGGSVRANVRRRVVCRGCAVNAGRRRTESQNAKCNGCGPSCPSVTKVVQRRMGMMIMNQEVEEPSKERCKEDLKALHATIERGAPEGHEVVFPRASEQVCAETLHGWNAHPVASLQVRPHRARTRRVLPCTCICVCAF